MGVNPAVAIVLNDHVHPCFLVSQFPHLQSGTDNNISLAMQS